MIGGEVYSTEKGKCNGIEIYLNPTAEEGKSTSCTKEDYTNNSDKLSNKGCMKWYVYDVSDNKYTMILDHNTTATVAWVSQEDYNNYDTLNYGITATPSLSDNIWPEYGTSGNHSKGPLTALKQLKEDTKDWNGLLTPKNYSIELVDIKQQNIKYTIDYSGYNARLITAEEVADISKNSDFNIKNPGQNYFYFSNNSSDKDTSINTIGSNRFAWLFDYMNGCTSSGCNMEKTDNKGYWTSSPIGRDKSTAFNIFNGGGLSYTVVSTNDLRGIRPVITVSKSQIIP